MSKRHRRARQEGNLQRHHEVLGFPAGNFDQPLEIRNTVGILNGRGFQTQWSLKSFPDSGLEKRRAVRHDLAGRSLCEFEIASSLKGLIRAVVLTGTAAI